jgi:hypothetical protein
VENVGRCIQLASGAVGEYLAGAVMKKFSQAMGRSS